MGFDRFRAGVVLRVVLLALTLLLMVVLWQHTTFLITVFLLGLVAVAQIVSLVRYLERTQRDLARFLEAIRYEDFFESFGRSSSPATERLHHEFARIIQDFQRVRRQREEQYLYLQTVVQHIGVALISFDSSGEVELVNNAAKKLFKVNRLGNISQLGRVSGMLVTTLRDIRPGEKQTVRVMLEGELLQLSIHATEFIRRGRRLTLVSIQNIRSELEEQELEAWQNLIRVLTHEIRNSITPITSLAATTGDLLSELDCPDSEVHDTVTDAKLAVSTIRKRGEGLLGFVEAFRSLYKIPKPNFTQLSLAELFHHLRTFFDSSLAGQGIDARFTCTPDDLALSVDPDLIEQVLINLITNSIQALQGRSDARLEVIADIDSRGHGRIRVVDNGAGIPSNVQEKIFIPFFTTKNDGTGIGLSLSRQIMRLHKGSVTFQSVPEKETVFTLTF